MTDLSDLPRAQLAPAALPDPASVRRIASDAEAIAVAGELAAAFATGAARRDRDRELPWTQLDQWSRSGLGAITVPRQYGGADVSYLTLAQVFSIVAAADASLGQIPQNHFGVLGVLREIGTEQQRRRFFHEVLCGGRLGNAGPERKSSTSRTILEGTTRLVRTRHGLRLSGRRFYSTGALFAHRVPTRALDDEGRLVQVWVPREASGLNIIDDWSSFGQRTTASGTVVFDQVPVAEDEVLPLWSMQDRPGLSGPTSQLLHAAIDLGIAEAALRDGLDFTRRHARPWVDSGCTEATQDPTLLHEVGRLQIAVDAAREVLHEAAQTLDAIAAAPVDAQASARASIAVAHAKVLTTEAALEVAEKLFELCGASATRARHQLDRHWRNARTHSLHDPVRWKLHVIGNYTLNNVLPARHSWN